MTANVTYALLWLSFGLAHSILTTGRVKSALNPWLGHRYRLIYNLVSTAHLALVIVVGYLLYRNTGSFDLYVWQRAIMLSLLVIGAVITVLALFQYDLNLFAGVTQWKRGNRGQTEVPGEALNTTGLNGYIRHPLYSGMFMMLWGNATDMFGFMTALWGSLYLIIGQGFEERKLVQEYGAAYTQYQQQVPAFIPWKGQVIKKRTKLLVK